MEGTRDCFPLVGLKKHKLDRVSWMRALGRKNARSSVGLLDLPYPRACSLPYRGTIQPR